MIKLVPTYPKVLSTANRNTLFGRFTYKATPTKDNLECITVTDKEWLKKLVKVPLPAEVAVLPGADVAWFHRLVASKFLALIDAWRVEGLLSDLVSWNGAYCARFTRGRPGILSAHSWGSAFDVNSAQNRLGQPATAIGTPGSVLRLVPAAERLGWCWGGRFLRPDPMHFEVAEL